MLREFLCLRECTFASPYVCSMYVYVCERACVYMYMYIYIYIIHIYDVSFQPVLSVWCAFTRMR
jgi:hypothetical protein